jgi:hypothetical protein
VVVILGIIVAIVLMNGPVTPPTSSGDGTTTTTPQSVASGASEATLAACEANFAAVSSALAGYRALNGASPPSGAAWATSSANGGPFLAAWPTDVNFYTIVWNGSTLTVVPGTGVASRGSFGTRTPRTGCYAA